MSDELAPQGRTLRNVIDTVTSPLERPVALKHLLTLLWHLLDGVETLDPELLLREHLLDTASLLGLMRNHL